MLVSANNKPYGSAYRYRLSAQFEPPYRAYRIAELLRLRGQCDAASLRRTQLDTLSPIDLGIARGLAGPARKDRQDEASADAFVASADGTATTSPIPGQPRWSSACETIFNDGPR